MKRLLGFVALVALAFGALVIVLAMRAREALARAKVDADLRVLVWSRFWTLVYGVPYTLHLAILANEGASSAARDGTYPKGDLGAARGPALGPGQVLRARYDRLLSAGRRRSWAAGDWDDARKDLYTRFWPWTLAMVRAPVDQYDLVARTRGSVWASVVILREALDETHGDLRAAARRYNGFGAAADAYASRAVEKMAALAS